LNVCCSKCSARLLSNSAFFGSCADLPGDFNHDGTVDTADYGVWRKGLGTTYTEDDYNAWHANFGATLNPGSGSGAPSAFPLPPSPLTPAVPEPTSLLPLALALVQVTSQLRVRRNAAGARRRLAGFAAD
jgi:hypothetical protein